LSSLSFRSALRVIRPSHLSWHIDNAEYEASAWKVYLCDERLMMVEGEERVVLKRVVRGVRSVA
jgi:UDP-N-acetylmuramoylalanine-D-glutamate ligase